MAKLSYIIMLIAILPLSAAFQIVDDEPFDYSGNSTILATNGWYAGTGTIMTYCQALAGYMECSMPAAGNQTFVHHIFNNVVPEYCLGLGGAENITSNYSVRYNIRYPSYIPVANFGSTPTNRPMPTMGTASSSNRDLSIYLIGQGNNTNQMQFRLHAQTGTEAIKTFGAWNSDWHSIQIDFEPYQYGASFPNMTIGNATLYVDGAFIGRIPNTAAPPLRYGCRNSTYFNFLASVGNNAVIDIDNLVVINYDSGESFFNANATLNVTIPPTTCTNFTPPYYLKEFFIGGYMTDCGWFTTPAIYMAGSMDITNDIPSVSVYKAFKDTTTGKNVALNSKYQTIKFDYFVDSTTISNITLLMFLYDSNFDTIIDMQVDNTADLYNVQDTTTLISTELTNNWNMVKIVTNLDTDTFDVYVGNVLKISGMDFYNRDQDVTDIYTIQFQSAQSQYQIDNVQVYTSDSNGNAINTPIAPPSFAQNDTYLFNMFYKTTPNCTTNADCISGMCLRTTLTCSAANYKICDENGWNRTDWCLFKGLVVGFLGWLGDIFLGNLFYFIIFLIVLMIIVYLVKIARREG